MSAHSDRRILLDMLTYQRPSGSAVEAAFVSRYLLPLGCELDDHGNYHKVISDSPVLWSSHIDTVHTFDGYQTLHYDGKRQIVELSKRSVARGAQCLGADDTAGVYIMHELIRAGVPGHYIFHADEESGGRGSNDLAYADPERIKGSQFAIALDRKGTADVITKQAGDRCASDAFALSLATQLNANGLSFAPSALGAFTDTANYIGLIGECTNLSVGYQNAHCPREWLDCAFVDCLFTALCKLDPSLLVAERVPEAPMEYDWRNWRNHDTNFKPLQSSFDLATFECETCGLWFDGTRSDAVDNQSYCCGECEDFARMDRELREQTRTSSTYLDPQYDDVQKALRKSALRVVGAK